MKQSEITVRVGLGRGTQAATVWTCDLSHDTSRSTPTTGRELLQPARRGPGSSVMNDKLEHLLTRAEQLIGRIEAALPQPPGRAGLERVDRLPLPAPQQWPGPPGAGASRCHDPARRPAGDRHPEGRSSATQRFVDGKSANNVLLTGARGTGKSSLIKACLQGVRTRGLRLIEVDKADLVDLPDIVDVVSGRPERFIVYCDDLSFDEGSRGTRLSKSILDGSVAETTPNVLVYATSNRRHLLPGT